MRSNLILSVAAVALSLGTLNLGISGALAATPTTNFPASSAGHITDLFPAQSSSSQPGLSRIANSKHSVSPKLATLSAAHSNRHEHIANLRAMHLAMRFVPSERMASASQDGLNTLRQKMSPQPSGLAGLKAAAGLSQAAASPPSPLAQQFAIAAAKAQPNDSVKLLSGH
jgi:hypothetical protein